MRKIVFLLMLGFTLLTACSSNNPVGPSGDVTGEKISLPGGGEYTNITATDLKMMLESKNFVLVNVHIPFEGDIPNTDLSIPFDKIADNLEKLPADKNAKIVLYCRSGRMSSIASEALVNLGYTNIWNLEGGMVAWEKEGFSLVGK